MRYPFPSDRDQLFFTPPTATGQPILGVPGRSIPIFLNQALTSVALDIVDADGLPLDGFVQITADSLCPDFFSPDNVDVLWINTANGPYRLNPKALPRAHRPSTSSEEIFRTKLAAESHPRVQMKADGTLFIGPGTVNPSEGAGALWDIQAPSGQLTTRWRSGSTGLQNISEWMDVYGNPVGWVGNVGGAAWTDFVSTARSAFGPWGVKMDIYGYLQMLKWGMFAHAGPPGNMALYPESSCEQFQGFRGATAGQFVGLPGTTVTVVTNPFTSGGLTDHPGESFNVRELFKNGAGTVGVRSGNSLAQSYPCKEGDYVKLFTNVRGDGTFRAQARFYDEDGVTISGGTITGDDVDVTSGSWKPIPVGGFAPEGTEGVEYQCSADGIADGAIIYESGFGVWKDTRGVDLGQDPNPLNVWSPAITPHPGDGLWVGAYTGFWYIRTDVPGTAGNILYVLDGGANFYYEPHQVSASGVPGVDPRWIERM